MIKFSIIMPVYNSQGYLKNAIQSILHQTFTNWELILIDDGSTDSSGLICDEYAKNDKRIRVFHQKNQGICKARNFGITMAIGNYVGFMDNDDEYCVDILERVAAVIIDDKPDVIKYGYQIEETFNQGFKQIRRKSVTKELYFSEKNLIEIYDEINQAGYFNAVWNGFYSRDFIDKNHLIFDTSIKAGYEDWIFNYHVCTIDCSQVMIAGIGYLYYQRCDHSTFKKFSLNQISALITAAACEKKMYKSININSRKIINWPSEAVKYIIELLLIFQRKGCNLSESAKMKYLKFYYDSEVFENIETALSSNLTLLRKVVVILFAKQHFKLLLFISKIYYQFILIKKRVK